MQLKEFFLNYKANINSAGSTVVDDDNARGSSSVRGKRKRPRVGTAAATCTVPSTTTDLIRCEPIQGRRVPDWDVPNNQGGKLDGSQQ